MVLFLRNKRSICIWDLTVTDGCSLHMSLSPWTWLAIVTMLEAVFFNFFIFIFLRKVFLTSSNCFDATFFHSNNCPKKCHICIPHISPYSNAFHTCNPPVLLLVIFLTTQENNLDTRSSYVIGVILGKSCVYDTKFYVLWLIWQLSQLLMILKYPFGWNSFYYLPVQAPLLKCTLPPNSSTTFYGLNQEVLSRDGE